MGLSKQERRGGKSQVNSQTGGPVHPGAGGRRLGQEEDNGN